MPLALTPAETAALLQVSVKRVRLLVALGQLAKLPDYRPIRIPHGAIEEYLARQPESPEREDELAKKRKLAAERAAFLAEITPKGKQAT
jgi:hypothetical protein